MRAFCFKFSCTHIALLHYGLLVLVRARLLDHFVTLFVYQQLALDTFEALPAQAPDPVMAVRAKGFLERERQEEVHQVNHTQCRHNTVQSQSLTTPKLLTMVARVVMAASAVYLRD